MFKRFLLTIALLLITSPAYCAVYTAIAAGGNWSSDVTWGGAGHPVAGDTANIDATMLGTVTVDAASACAVLNCAGATGTLALNAGLTCSGSFTLASGMTFTPNAQTVTLTGTGTLTSGTKSFWALTIGSAGGAITVTLGDDITVNSTLTFTNNGGQITLNSNNLNAKGNIAYSNQGSFGITGTTTLKINGSGNQTIGGLQSNYSAGDIGRWGLNTVIISTGGTVSFTGTWDFGHSTAAPTLTYTSGTCDTVSNTHTLRVSSSATLVTNGCDWYDIYYYNGTFTHTSDITSTHDVTFNTSAGQSTLNTSILHAKGSVAYSSVGGYGVAGTTDLYIDGSGAQTIGAFDSNSGAGDAGCWGLDVRIASTGGTVTMGTKWEFGSSAVPTFTYASGTTDWTTNTCLLYTTNSTNLNMGTMTLYDFQVSLAGTATLTGNMKIANTCTIDASRTLSCGSNTLTLQNNLVNSGTFTAGTSTTVFDGTSTVSGNNTTFYTMQINDGKTVHLTSAKTYTVTNGFNVQGISGSAVTLDATTPDTQAVLTVSGSHSVSYCNATDIDSSLGNPISDTGGVLDNATNWTVVAPPVTTTTATFFVG